MVQLDTVLGSATPTDHSPFARTGGTHCPTLAAKPLPKVGQASRLPRPWERWRLAGEIQFSDSDWPAGRRRSREVHAEINGAWQPFHSKTAFYWHFCISGDLQTSFPGSGA